MLARSRVGNIGLVYREYRLFSAYLRVELHAELLDAGAQSRLLEVALRHGCLELRIVE